MAKRSLSQIKLLDQNQPHKVKKGLMPRCGLCGNTENLTKTECCNNWICDDEGEYVLFSFARNSCSRNHRRFTLCGNHYESGHEGRWQDCEECREGIETEMYVFYGTNEYNFEKLKNPPKYKPTRCKQCNRVIRLGYDGYAYASGGYLCQKCSDQEFGEVPDFTSP